MKKSLLIMGAILTTLSLTAYTYISWEHSENENEIECKAIEPITASANEVGCAPPIVVKEHAEVGCRAAEVHPDFVYNVSNEFNTTITVKDLQKATSIVDLLPAEATEKLSQYRDVKVDVVPNNNNTAIEGVDENLNNDQLELLKSMDYSTNFYLEAHCKNNNTRYGPMDNYHLVYYLTVVPETAAQYNKGQDALITYLKEGSKNQASACNWDETSPGRLHFTVSKEGTISDASTSNSCGNLSLDEQMIKLIKAMPGNWTPASNSTGDKVAQDFVFFYGKQGC